MHEEVTRNMAEGVVLVRTADWEIVYANRKFEEMFGYEPGELLGLSVDVVNAQDERDPAEVRRGDPGRAGPRRFLVGPGPQRQEGRLGRSGARPTCPTSSIRCTAPSRWPSTPT